MRYSIVDLVTCRLITAVFEINFRTHYIEKSSGDKKTRERIRLKQLLSFCFEKDCYILDCKNHYEDG